MLFSAYDYEPVKPSPEAKYYNIAGFSLAGLAARFLQLGIAGRPLLYNPWAHGIHMAIMGTVGYYAWCFDNRAVDIIAGQRMRIRANRIRKLAEREAEILSQDD